MTQPTPGPCGCKISGPLGVGAVLGEAPVRLIEGGPVYGITYCPTHAAASDMREALSGLFKCLDSHANICPQCILHRNNARALLARIEGKPPADPRGRCKCGDYALDGKATCGRLACGPSTGRK